MKTLILTALLLLAGCTSPYQGQVNLMTEAYQRGEMSSSDYYQRVNELQSLELQRREAASQAFFNYSNATRPQRVYIYRGRY